MLKSTVIIFSVAELVNKKIKNFFIFILKGSERPAIIALKGAINMTEIRQTIIDNLKAVCKVKKIKNVDIAAFMGVSAGSVSNWFKGTNFLDVENLYKLCQWLGVSLDQIFGVSPIVFGALSPEENDLVVCYRKADAGTQAAVRKLLDVPDKKDGEMSGI